MNLCDIKNMQTLGSSSTIDTKTVQGCTMFIKVLYGANLQPEIETLAQLRMHLVFKYVQKLDKLDNAL